MAPKKPKKKLSAYNKHVQREMKAGKSMKQAAASWSKKSGAPKSKASKSNKSSKSKGGNTTVTKNGFNTQKIFKYFRYGALVAPAAAIAMRSDSNENKIRSGIKAYFGYDMRTGAFPW